MNEHWIPYLGTRTEFFPNAVANIVSLPARQITIDCNGKTVCLNNEIGKVAESGGHRGFWLGTVIVIGVGALIVTPTLEPREFNPSRK